MNEEEALLGLAEAASGRAAIGAAVADVFTLAKTLGPRDATRILGRLDPLVRSAPVETLGRVSLLAGALVEIGADVAGFPPSVFDRLGVFLDGVPASTAPRSDGDEEEPEPLPESFYMCERAAMAALSRSVELRRTLRQKAVLLGKIRRYEERYGFLGKMLEVRDDEPLVILHPSSRRGWRARFGGIADNFQLHALLRAALAGTGPDRIAGQPPRPSSVAANTDGPTEGAPPVPSDWQLAQWRAILPDGSLPGQKDTKHWIWNEGFPAEIEPFEGTRVVAIGPSTIQRSWNASRVFFAMRGWLTVESRLTPDEASALLTRIAAAR
jgi:hypothetical protein